MGSGLKGLGALIMVALPAIWSLAGCAGKAAAPSAAAGSASQGGGAGASGSAGANNGFDASTAATSSDGGDAQTTPDVPDGCALAGCCTSDETTRSLRFGQPCPTEGAICGPGGCTLNCYCLPGDGGVLTWECWAPPCK